MLKPLKFLLFFATCLWLVIGFCGRLDARAGGAGGHSSSSHGSSSHSSSSSSHGSSYRSSSGSRGSSGSSSFGTLIFIIIIAVVVIIIYQNVSKKLGSKPDTSGVVSSRVDVDSAGIQAFLAAQPDFDVSAFVSKARNAFREIQEAWTAQNISPIRRFITDGMYQRFATQFRMMGLLKQSNRLDRIRILRALPVSARIDGAFDVINVHVEAVMRDAFVCGLDHSLDSESELTFVEYWSFIRKRGAVNSGFNVFADKTCPSCGAELPQDMGEVCRCAHCQVIVNSGDFDWVLAEITQEDDYGKFTHSMGRSVSPQLPEADLALIAAELPDFSVQMAEDKASNAFMQIMTAIATRNPASVRRFVSDEMFTTISGMIPESHIIFDRIYLNESTLLSVWKQETKHHLQFSMCSSMQRVELLSDGSITSLDASVVRTQHVLVMERDADAVPEKGSLYQHQCPSCGGAIGDTIDVNCQYCGTPLNSTRGEWIVCAFGAPE